MSVNPLLLKCQVASLDNKVLRRAVERALQVAVEACLDIGRRLIALEGFRYPEDNRDVFQVLAEEGADIQWSLFGILRVEVRDEPKSFFALSKGH